MRKPPISSGAAISFAVAAIALELVASLMYTAAPGSSSGLSVEPSKLLASGPNGASLIRWGSLIDMLGYLCIAPVVVYLRARYSAARYADIFAAAGLAVVVIGSIGAATMATAAPALMLTSCDHRMRPKGEPAHPWLCEPSADARSFWGCGRRWKPFQRRFGSSATPPQHDMRGRDRFL